MKQLKKMIDQKVEMENQLYVKQNATHIWNLQTATRTRYKMGLEWLKITLSQVYMVKLIQMVTLPSHNQTSHIPE